MKIKEVITMLEKANKIRLFNAMKNKDFLYETICQTPGITNYELSKKIKWSNGKVAYYAQKLVSDGLIKNSTEIINGRTQKRFTPVDYKEFIKKEEMKFLK